MRASILILALALWPGSALAQGSGPGWLSRTVAVPPTNPPVSDDARPDPIVVEPLDRPVPDTVGLVDPEAAGLDADPWSASEAEGLARRLDGLGVPRLAATQDLLRRMLIATADPPEGSDGERFFLSRLDALMAAGAFAPARQMMERAGYDRPEVFRRWFDLALLTGQEEQACARMRAAPRITPTYPARIFCLARSGDWPAAAVTLETARALSVVTPAEMDRLARFLDAYAEGVNLPPPERPTPLDYMLYEAMGEPLRSAALPLPFAHADLRRHIGWKARIAAAERLARAGALDAGALWNVYGEHDPAASGQPWDRVAGAQALDRALEEGDAAAVSELLPGLWEDMRATGLGPALAARATDRPVPRALDAPAAEILTTLRHLADDDPDPPAPTGDAALDEAIVAGLAGRAATGRGAELVAQGQSGEALLHAIALLDLGAEGNLDALRDGLATLVAAGQDRVARRAATEIALAGGPE